MNVTNYKNSYGNVFGEKKIEKKSKKKKNLKKNKRRIFHGLNFFLKYIHSNTSENTRPFRKWGKGS